MGSIKLVLKFINNKFNNPYGILKNIWHLCLVEKILYLYETSYKLHLK